MSRNSKLPAKSTFGYASQSLPFGPPPILEGEDRGAYDELLGRILSEMKPDKIGEIWTRDITDHTWEILRWRRLKARLLSDVISIRVRNILDPQIRGRIKLAEKWATGDPTAVKRVGKLMASKNVTMESVHAQAVMEKLDEIERIDHLIMVLEARRNAAFREIDRHRTTFAQALRGKVNEIEGEFETIERNPVVAKITGDNLHDQRAKTRN